jgi:hypothetical protein
VITREQWDVLLGLVHYPGRSPISTTEDVLRCFGASDGVSLGLHLLERAVAECGAEDVEGALLVCSKFGFTPEHQPLLLELASAEWHHSHEDVVWYLGDDQGSEIVNALIRATEWIPRYLNFDESRSLARKAVRGLGRQQSEKARDALRRLAVSDHEIIRTDALKQLERLKGE